MEEIISEYRRLLELLKEEEVLISRSLQGELLEIYRDILTREEEEIERYLRLNYQIY